jgi:hypothetical protein
MNKHRQRQQSAKRIDRHTSLVMDKGRHTKGQRAPRYNRDKDGAW